MNLLLTGDIHIHNYTDHNLNGNRFRLDQFLKLAERLVDIADEKNCEYLAIAGDLIHKPILTPIVAEYVEKFLEILSKRFPQDKLFIIWGNHDVNSKSQELGYEDSTLLAFNNYFTYADRQILKLGNSTVAFANWRPKQDLDFIQDKVDLFVGHVTIHPVFGQEIDHTKFSLGLAGDIHNVSNDGNLHTINVPIPHYISDEQEGSVVVYDTATKTFERVLTNNDKYQFLKICYEDTQADFNNPLTVSVKRPIKAKSSQVIHKSVNIDEVIEKLVKETKLENTYKSIIERFEVISEKPLDLDFKLNRIEIHDFLSIEHLDFQFPPGLLSLSGKNGEGKSTLIKAIDYIFNPPRSSKDFVKLGKSQLKITLDFDYKGKAHTITRTGGSNSSVQYSIDGEEIVGVSIAEVNKTIEENLDFLQVWDILYRYQASPYLLSGFNYSQRIELVSKLLGLSKVAKLNELAAVKSKEVKNEISNLTNLRQIHSTTIQAVGDKDFSMVEKKDELSNLYNTKKNELDSVELRLKEVTDTNLAAKQYNAGISDSVAKRKALVDQLSYIPKENTPERLVLLNNQISEGQSFLDSQEEKVKAHDEKIDALKNQRMSIQLDIQAKEKELNGINLSNKVCSSCGREFDNAKDIQDHYEKIFSELEQIRSNSSTQLAVINEELDKLLAIKQNDLQFTKEIRDTLTNLISLKMKVEGDVHSAERITNDLKEYENLDLTLKPEIPLEEIEAIQNQRFNLNNEVQSIKFNLMQIDNLTADYNRLKEAEIKLTEIETQLNELNAEYEDIDKFRGLTHATGPIIQSVFITIAEILTEDKFAVRTVKSLKSGETRIDFDVDYKVEDNFINYQNLSGGQKVVVDIFFLTRLFEMAGQVGLLMLDETLKDLDIDNLEKTVILLRQSPIDLIMLVTHVESFNYYDVRLKVEKVNGNSIYTAEGA